MHSFLIKPSLRVIVFQLVVVLFFSLSLYWFIQSKTVLVVLQEQLHGIQTRSRQLKLTEEKLLAYEQFLGKRPEMLTVPEEITWEKVDFSWKDISYQELLKRLEGVYSKERVFVLESFSFQPAGGTVPTTLQKPDQPADRQFQLKGYYLCLCR